MGRRSINHAGALALSCRVRQWRRVCRHHRTHRLARTLAIADFWVRATDGGAARKTERSIQRRVPSFLGIARVRIQKTEPIIAASVRARSGRSEAVCRRVCARLTGSCATIYMSATARNADALALEIAIAALVAPARPSIALVIHTSRAISEETVSGTRLGRAVALLFSVARALRRTAHRVCSLHRTRGLVAATIKRGTGRVDF